MNPSEVAVDRDRCIGAGRCLHGAPDVFDADDEGLVLLLRAEVDPSRIEAVRAAVRLCPARAITLRDPVR